jgi:hypothetical protein
MRPAESELPPANRSADKTAVLLSTAAFIRRIHSKAQKLP